MSTAFRCDACEKYDDGEARGTFAGWGGCDKKDLCSQCAKLVRELLQDRRPGQEVPE